MRKAIFVAVVLGIMGWLGLDCSAQNYGIPQGSRFQPVITPGDGTRLGNEMLKGKSSKQAKQKKKPAAKPKVETTEEQNARWEREKDEKELEELAPKLRTWTDSTGSRTVEATFVELEQDQVTLKKKGGKEVTVPLARLSKNDQEWAKTEARFQEIIADYTKKVAETETKRAALKKEQKELVAKYGPVGPLDERMAKNTSELSKVPSRSDLRKQRDQNIKKAVNAYCVAIGKEPLYVANLYGDLEERSKVAAREARENQREEQAKTNGTPRLAADNYYIQGLLKNGTLQEATYVGEQFVTPGPQRSSTERGMGAALGVGGGGAGPLADPTKWKAVYYHVKYVSRGGFAMEKDSYVLTYRVENARVVGAGARPEDGGLWAVENFYLDGVKGD